jgi:cob(I)alamin adenosyltransferase
MIYVFTGQGGGKTIAALGLALRACGQGKKVVIIQFMKGRRDTGEYKAARRIGYNIYQFGRKGFVNIDNPEPLDFELALAGLKKARSVKADLLILDEISLAVSIGLLPEKEVLTFLRKVPKRMDVVLTGRQVPNSFIKIADGASEIKKIKHVFDKGVKAKRGIEY